MLDRKRTEDDLSSRRKQLAYRAGHRGIREMDLILGGFSLRHIGELSRRRLDAFERLLEENDQDLLAWFTGQAAAPERIDADLVEAIRADAMKAAG